MNNQNKPQQIEETGSEQLTDESLDQVAAAGTQFRAPGPHLNLQQRPSLSVSVAKNFDHINPCDPGDLPGGIKIGS